MMYEKPLLNLNFKYFILRNNSIINITEVYTYQVILHNIINTRIRPTHRHAIQKAQQQTVQ